VIEHVANPHFFAEKVRELLSPSGKLLLSTRNTSSLVHRLSGARWRYFDLPVHISYFSSKNLRQLLAKHGLEVYDNVLLGFSWLDILISWRLKFLLPLFRLAALPTGVFVIAKKL